MSKERLTAADIVKTHFIGQGIESRTEEEQKFEKQVLECEDFDQLFELLRSKTDGIRGTSSLYPPEEIIRRIERVRNGHDVLQRVTRTFGINGKVAELQKQTRNFRSVW
jgi:hypothetical protein